MQIVFFDDPLVEHLLPLTFTRPAADLRVGILTIAEKWTQRLELPACYKVHRSYLSDKFPFSASSDNLFINGRILCNDKLLEATKSLQLNQGLKDGDLIIAHRSENEFREDEKIEWREISAEGQSINFPYDIFTLNGQEIEADFEWVTANRKSAPIPEGTRTKNADRIFIEEGATVDFSILNAENGAIYIGKHAQVLDNSTVRGPFALCNNAVLKMAAKIYGPTTIGPHSKVGGEVNNVVFQAYSNKGHDGFLGNAVIGQWCNLGADTNNSNLKNNYAEVKLWDYPSGRFKASGLQFCGLIMGDHSKSGIHTMFNTGTVIGVGCNIFGAGFPRNFVPSFSWGGHQGFTQHKIQKFLETAELVMQRRSIDLDSVEQNILQEIYNEETKDVT